MLCSSTRLPNLPLRPPTNPRCTALADSPITGCAYAVASLSPNMDVANAVRLVFKAKRTHFEVAEHRLRPPPSQPAVLSPVQAPNPAPHARPTHRPKTVFRIPGPRKGLGVCGGSVHQPPPTTPPPLRTHETKPKQALPTYVATFMFFSGFLIRYDDIPVWWKW